MTLRLTLGIDPGMSGAVVTLIDGEPGPILDMPTRQIGKDHRVDGIQLAAWIRGQRMENRGAYVSACIEKVGAIPMEGRKQGGVSMFNFGHGAGKLEGVLESCGIPYTHALPVSWKRYYGLTGQDKDVARLLAIRRFPSIADQLQRKKDGGRADALLIALWHENTQLQGNIAA